MKQAHMLIASAAVIALTLGVTSRADPSKESEPPLPLGSFIIAADQSQADTAGNDQGSAKMGEKSGTQNDAGNSTLENDTGKADQAAGGNPPAGKASE